MTTWGEFASSQPELGALGEARFASEVAYLATVRKDGSPRVHPVSPRLKQGHLIVFMFSSSPKVGDLKRDPRFALHAAVDGPNAEGGEFAIRGRARSIDDAAVRKLVEPVIGSGEYVAFELDVEEAHGFPDGGSFMRWRAP